jgi:hypothetical protein
VALVGPFTHHFPHVGHMRSSGRHPGWSGNGISVSIFAAIFHPRIEHSERSSSLA